MGGSRKRAAASDTEFDQSGGVLGSVRRAGGALFSAVTSRIRGQPGERTSGENSPSVSVEEDDQRRSSTEREGSPAPATRSQASAAASDPHVGGRARRGAGSKANKQSSPVKRASPSSAPTPARAVHLTDDPVRNMTVKELKARAAVLGLSIVGCSEKADLIALILRAQDRDNKKRNRERVESCHASDAKCPARASGIGKGAERRATKRLPTPGAQRGAGRVAKEPPRKSLRRSLATQMHQMRQEEELRRIASERDYFKVLGLSYSALNNLSKRERQKAITREYRQLSRFVHPDKCAPQFRVRATQIFQKLELSRQRVLEHCGLVEV